MIDWFGNNLFGKINLITNAEVQALQGSDKLTALTIKSEKNFWVKLQRV